MANAVDAALRRVSLLIPDMVIHAAFGTDRNKEFYIREHVLYDVVKFDVSLLGGKLEDVKLQEHWLEQDDRNDITIIRIPPEAIARREIIDFVEIVEKTQLAGYGTALPAQGYQPTTSGRLRAVGDYYSMRVFGNDQYVPDAPRCRLREGLLTVSPRLYLSANTRARVRLSMDSEISDMNTASVLPFVKVMTLATKMTLWNRLINKGLKLDSRVHELISDWNPEGLVDEYNEALVAFINSMNQDPDQFLSTLHAMYGS